MTDAEKQKLNERLARWAGFFQDPRLAWGHPNFTNSFDACEKWLVPKLDKYSISKNNKLSINIDCPERITAEVMVDASYRRDGFLIRNELWGRAMDNSAPSALCLAIEKLIDKEVRSERASEGDTSKTI